MLAWQKAVPHRQGRVATAMVATWLPDEKGSHHGRETKIMRRRYWCDIKRAVHNLEPILNLLPRLFCLRTQ